MALTYCDSHRLSMCPVCSIWLCFADRVSPVSCSTPSAGVSPRSPSPGPSASGAHPAPSSLYPSAASAWVRALSTAADASGTLCHAPAPGARASSESASAEPVSTSCRALATSSCTCAVFRPTAASTATVQWLYAHYAARTGPRRGPCPTSACSKSRRCGAGQCASSGDCRGAFLREFYC